MTRTARVVVPGMPHHITQRGIRRSDVFRDDSDRLLYHSVLRESCARFGLRICAYCLMPNHVHYVAFPEKPNSIWKTLHHADTIYATRFNKKYGLAGHLWQGRPFSCVLDESHLWAAIRYVERNPVRAGMVSSWLDYCWSSARSHSEGWTDSLLNYEWPSPIQVSDWKEWLDGAKKDETAEQLIRDCTFTGRPCGDERFIDVIGEMLHRSLKRKKPGRKPKPQAPPDEGPNTPMLF